MDLYYFFIAVVAIYLVVYSAFFFFYSKKVQKIENAIISRFLLKVSKIPSLIEVMRNFVADESAFDSLTKLHSTAMIHRYETIYVLLEHNARIQAEFAFLMKLSIDGFSGFHYNNLRCLPKIRSLFGTFVRTNNSRRNDRWPEPYTKKRGCPYA